MRETSESRMRSWAGAAARGKGQWWGRRVGGAAVRGDRVGQCLKGVSRSMETCRGSAWRAAAHRKATGIPSGRMALWKRSMCS